jgi:putative transposase
MPDYRRVLVPGATYFFTVNLQDRKRGLLVSHIDLLREAVRDVRAKRPFEIVAWSVMPDHMHAIWTLPETDSDYAARWLAIKAIFSRRLPLNDTEQRNDSRIKRGERGIWQRRFWEHMIRDDRDLDEHIRYVHFNPVKHGYVEVETDWPHSSIHRYIASDV